MPLITETYYLSLTQDNRGILRLRCSQDDTLRTVNLKLYNNGSIFVIPSGVSASVSGVKQNGAVFSKPCTISQNRESVVLQLSSDITNVDGIIVAEVVLNDGEGGRLGTSNFIIQVEKNPIRAGVVQDTETPIEYINDFIEKIQTLTARLNNLITPSGDPSLAEVVDARMGILDSTTYQTLGARLNAEFQRLSNALNGITILESTGDTTDRTSAILSKLNAYGTCKLGKGDFYVKNLVMPEDSMLIGSGNATRIVLLGSETNTYIVKPKSGCIIENISFDGGFTGTYSELIANSDARRQRHCIILDKFNDVNSENVILSNIFISNFVGSAIVQRATNGCHCKDVVINMCYAGIDISNASYDGQCANTYISNTKYGIIQNGSNFVFSSCISKDSVQHIMSDQQNTECTFSSCTFFDSSLETTSVLAYLSNARNGFVFDNCMFDSSLKMGLNACDGIVIKGTNFVGSDTFKIIVSNGRNTLLLITDCIADVEPVVTNAGTAARITSCYLKDGTAWSISETQDDSGGSSTLAELTDTDISSEQDGQVLTYDGTSHKWVNRTPSGSSVEIEVDDELSDESENPVQNKVINGAISEIKADLGDNVNDLKSAFDNIIEPNVNIVDLTNIIKTSESVSVSVNDGKITVTSGGGNNYLYIKLDGVVSGTTYEFDVVVDNDYSFRSKPLINEIVDLTNAGTNIATSGDKSNGVYHGEFTADGTTYNLNAIYLVLYINYTPASGSFTTAVTEKQLHIKDSSLSNDVQEILADVTNTKNTVDTVTTYPGSILDLHNITNTTGSSVSVNSGAVSYTSGGVNGYINIPLNNVQIGVEYVVNIKMNGKLTFRSVPKIYYRIDPNPSVNGTLVATMPDISGGEYNGTFTITAESGVPASSIYLVLNINYTPTSGSFIPSIIPNTGIEIDSKKLSYEVQIELGVDGNPAHYKGSEITAFNKIACIGDSITNGVFNYGNNQTVAIVKYGYPAMLQKITGITADNLGHGGYTSVGWYSEFGNTDFSSYDCAVIELGINDALQSVSIENSTQALQNIIDKLQSDVTGIKIFIASITPAYSDGVSTFDNIDAALESLVSCNTNCYYLNSKKYSDVRKGTKYVNGHLTAEGYYKYAEEIASMISSIINGNPSEFRGIQFIGTNYSMT